MAEPQRDLTGTLLAAASIGALIVTAFWIVRPFAAATVWAMTVVVVSWPLMRRLQARMGGSRALAIAVMLTIVLLLIAVPLTLAVAVLLVNAASIAENFRSIAGIRMGDAPAWVASLPVVGAWLAATWNDAASAGLEGAWLRLAPYAGSLTAWFIARLGNLGFLTLQFLLTLVLAGFMYAHGEALADASLRFGRRLGGRQGEDLVRLVASAIRGVALGVGVTAAVQSVLAGLGLVVAGVPFAGVLTAALFILCVAQVGMLVVLIPAVAWVYWSGHPVWGTLLLVWSLAASLLDLVLRPLLVRRSARLPALLIFVGVIGGLVAFGLLGLFVGPVVLAVAYTLLVSWIEHRPPGEPRPSGPA